MNGVMTLAEQNLRLKTAYHHMNSEGRDLLDRLTGQLAEVHRQFRGGKDEPAIVPLHGFRRVNRPGKGVPN